jgi:YggT family protein
LNVLFFLLKTFTDMYLLVVFLRFLLQLVRADFYNPFSQFVVQITNPLVVPARRLIPSIGTIDAASFVVLFLIQLGVTYLLIALLGGSPDLASLLLLTALRLLSLAIWAYTLAIIVSIVISWIGQGNYNPIGIVAAQIAAPVLRPFRKIIPIVGGLDLSPMIVVILLYAASYGLQDLGLPPQLR